MNKKRLNRVKILVIVIIIALIYPTAIFGRYVYNVANDMYLTSKKFYFESDYLDTNNPIVTNNGWNGNGTYSVDFHLYSYKNEQAKLDYDLEYTLTYTCSSDKIDFGVDSACTTKTKTGIIDADAEISANTVTEVFYVKVKSGETVEYNDVYEIDVVAVATGYGEDEAKYTKTIKARYQLTIVDTDGPKFSITDKTGDAYAVLTLKNPRIRETYVTLTFNPDEIRIDTDNNYYTGFSKNSNAVGNSVRTPANVMNTMIQNILVRNSVIENIVTGITVNTTNTIVPSEYISKIKFKLEAETSTSIKMYKKNVSSNYSNSGDNTNSVVDVQYSN